MATQLNNWTFARTRRVGKSKFDFVFDGKPWKLKRGEDFTTAALSVRHMLYARGRKLKKLVHTQEVPDGIIVQAEARRVSRRATKDISPRSLKTVHISH